MAQSTPRSLKHEYEIFVDQEIENYKDSIPRSAILRIGDEAVLELAEAKEPGFDEILLCTQVDQIIRRRLRVPTYATWRRRRLKLIAEYRRPERWGLTADTPLVREIPADREANVVLLGAEEESTAMYLAANGCHVTAVQEDANIVERVLNAAGQVGLTSRVVGHVGPVANWYPNAPLNAVVSSSSAFAGLAPTERTRVIQILKSATIDGGVHLVQTIAAGSASMSADELRRQYQGWSIAVVRDGTFMARKGAA
jgi:hypothetical protein